MQCCGLAPAGNKNHTIALILLPSPPVGWGEEPEGKGKNWWAAIKTV